MQLICQICLQFFVECMYIDYQDGMWADWYISYIKNKSFMECYSHSTEVVLWCMGHPNKSFRTFSQYVARLWNVDLFLFFAHYVFYNLFFNILWILSVSCKYLYGTDGYEIYTLCYVWRPRKETRDYVILYRSFNAAMSGHAMRAILMHICINKGMVWGNVKFDFKLHCDDQ